MHGAWSSLLKGLLPFWVAGAVLTPVATGLWPRHCTAAVCPGASCNSIGGTQKSKTNRTAQPQHFERDEDERERVTVDSTTFPENPRQIACDDKGNNTGAESRLCARRTTEQLNKQKLSDAQMPARCAPQVAAESAQHHCPRAAPGIQ